MHTKSWHFPHLFSVAVLLLAGLPGVFFQLPVRSLAMERDDLTHKEMALREEAAPNGAGGSLGILSISAADFRPSVASNSYENHGRYLIHLDGDSAYGYYFAPLLLPHGATITRFTLVFRDNSTSNLTANLYRDNSFGMNDAMAQLDSSGSYSSPWYGSKITTNIQYAVIDNSSYAYFVSLQIPESTPGSSGPLVWFTGISIEFQYPSTTTNPRYFSIPVAGFTAYQDGYTYLNTGRYLYHNSGPGGETTNNGWYFARLQLPDGATITSLTLYYDINSSYSGYVRLQRSKLGYGDYSNMSTMVIPAGTQGHDDMTTTAISNPLVDNVQYAYWISLDIPPLDRPNSTLIPLYVVIGYSNPTSSGSSVLLSIPAPAFTPYEDGYDYQNDARFLSHYHDPSDGNERGWYLAAVQIPQGARVTGMTFYWHDQNASYSGIARLQRTDMAGNYDEMAVLTSNGALVSGSFGKTVTNSITNPVIDNRYHTYWVVWDLPVTSVADIRGCSMSLTYSFLLYMPVVRK
jgi:hypothetical protein